MICGVRVNGGYRIYPTRELDRYIEIAAPYVKPEYIDQNPTLVDPNVTTKKLDITGQLGVRAQRLRKGRIEDVPGSYCPATTRPAVAQGGSGSSPLS